MKMNATSNDKDDKTSLPAYSLRCILLASLLLAMTAVAPMQANAEDGVIKDVPIEYASDTALSRTKCVEIPEGGTVKSDSLYGRLSAEHIYDATGKKIKSVEYYEPPKPVEKVALEDPEIALDKIFIDYMKKIDPYYILNFGTESLQPREGQTASEAIAERKKVTIENRRRFYNEMKEDVKQEYKDILIDRRLKNFVNYDNESEKEKKNLRYFVESKINSADIVRLAYDRILEKRTEFYKQRYGQKLGEKFHSIPGPRSAREKLLFDVNLNRGFVNKTDYTLEHIGETADAVINEYKYDKNNKLLGSISKDPAGNTLYYTKISVNGAGKITQATDFDPATKKTLMLKLYNKNSQVEKMYPYENGRVQKEQEIAISYYDTGEIKSVSKGTFTKVVSHYSKEDGLIIKQETYKNKELYTVVEGNNNPDLARGVTKRVTFYNQKPIFVIAKEGVKNYKQIFETIDPKNSLDGDYPVTDFAFTDFENLKRTVSFTYANKNQKIPQIEICFHRAYSTSEKPFDIIVLTNGGSEGKVSNIVYNQATVTAVENGILPFKPNKKLHTQAQINKKWNDLEYFYSKRYRVDLKTRQIIDNMPNYEKEHGMDRYYFMGDY